jgi:hypothetical protein
MPRGWQKDRGEGWSHDHAWSASPYYGNGFTVSPEFRARFPGPPCKTLIEMTEAEIVALEREYGCAVIRPERPGRRGSVQPGA